MDASSANTAPLTRRERDALVQEYHLLTEALLVAAEDDDVPLEKEASLQEAREAVLKTYFDRLPRRTLSRCPFCAAPLVRAFDPWGIEGFWWQHDETVPFEEPAAPPHFGVLLGAVNLNGQPPRGGRSPAHLGPEVPYVIPRLLEQPGLAAVVAAMPLTTGYTAYPIAYFSETPHPPGFYTQPWTKTQYDFQDAEGTWRWTLRHDPWDFDLRPWVERGKLRWIEPGDDTFTVQRGPWDAFPYRDLEGRREQLIIEDDTLTTIPPPSGEAIDPFE